MKIGEIYCQTAEFIGKFEPLKDAQDPPEELRKNLRLSDLKCSPEEVVALASFGALTGGIICGSFLILALVMRLSLLVPAATSSLPVLLYFSLGSYPEWKAKKRRKKSLEGTPRLISYLTVALQINPNLEKATIFSASRTEKSVGDSFRNEIWKACLGVHKNVHDALSKFSEGWGAENNELKRAIDLIKSSISERNERTRKRILDQALNTSFEGIRNRMEKFAANVQLPTTVIYGIGVLLPLVLLAVLPVISSTGFRLSGTQLALIYCLILPLGVYILERHILSKRPEPFSNPEIPSKDDRRKAIAVSVSVLIAIPSGAILLGLSNTMITLAALWGISLSITAFCYLSSVKTFEVREMNRELEEEFCDALTQLGSRLKSNIPVEEALLKTAETTKGGQISKILERTSTNLKMGGMSTRSAFFDPEDGSLKEVHSKSVLHTFRMLVSLLNRSSETAGEAILQTGKHLKRMNEAEKRVRRTLQSVISSMKSVALFFGPFVASVTVQLQQVLSEKTQSMPIFGMNVRISSPTFLGVLGTYVIIITLLLTVYTVEIEIGDDGPMKRMSIARALPTAITVFTAGLILGGQLMSILIG